MVATGRVKCSTYVNVRKGAGTGNALVGKVTNGTKVSIYQTTTVGSYKWGRIDSGWICMAYVELDGSSGGSDSDETVSGKVTGATMLNVRSGPGTSYSRVDSLAKGAKVTIYERTT